MYKKNIKKRVADLLSDSRPKWRKETQIDYMTRETSWPTNEEYPIHTHTNNGKSYNQGEGKRQREHGGKGKNPNSKF